jgi:hypothetical protein
MYHISIFIGVADQYEFILINELNKNMEVVFIFFSIVHLIDVRDITWLTLLLCYRFVCFCFLLRSWEHASTIT